MKFLATSKTSKTFFRYQLLFPGHSALIFLSDTNPIIGNLLQSICDKLGTKLAYYKRSMARINVPISTELPYHIGARCINQEWFTIPLHLVWEIMENYLYLLRISFDFRIHSFVLMSNHFHMIARAPKGNMSEAMNYFMRETSRAIGKKANRINQVYGGRFFRCLLGNHHYYLHAYKYVYRNPVEAGICKFVTDYPYSTLAGLVGAQKLIIPVEYDDILFESFDSTLDWLNATPQSQHKEEIKKALKKKEFKFALNANTKRANPLEEILY